jgi:glycosyltransferase involved in cell wall biosynthesis
VISCLRRAGVQVAERHIPVWEGDEHKWRAGPVAALRLAAAEARLLARPRESFDAIVVGYPGHLDLAAARRAAGSGSRPVVFNPLVSLSDTLVGDRGRFRTGGVAEQALRAIDRYAFRAADLVVSDTAANAALFRSLGAGRVEVCFVGAEERVFTPGWSPPDEFTALFVGKLIPLHGLETILAAARLAPDLRFRVVGSGQLDRLLDDRPANVAHVPWIEYERLPDELHRAACALGIFGTSPKAARVIPNKVFQALACGTPVVTADTPAARELLRDGESGLLVPAGDPEALVAALRRVTPELGRKGYAAYRELASEEILGARWRGLIQSLL